MAPTGPSLRQRPPRGAFLKPPALRVVDYFPSLPGFPRAMSIPKRAMSGNDVSADKEYGINGRNRFGQAASFSFLGSFRFLRLKASQISMSTITTATTT